MQFDKDSLISKITAGEGVTDPSKDQRVGEKGWETALIDLANPVPPPKPLLIQTSTGTPLLYRGGIHVSSGKQKAGKTFYNSILMAALTNPTGFMGLEPTDSYSVLFADTEQNRDDVQEVIKRVHRINNWDVRENEPTLRGISLREYSVPERIQLTENALKDLQPDVLILDGAVDFCLDFNSLEESHAVTSMLMKWTVEYGVSIVTSLHINKGNDELRGHLGAFLAQKGDSVIRISKENDGLPYMAAKVIDSRHRSIDDFSFRIEDGLPEAYESSGSTRAVDYLDIFDGTEPTTYTDLVNKITSLTGKSSRTAKRYIEEASKAGILVKKMDFMNSIINKNAGVRCQVTHPPYIGGVCVTDTNTLHLTDTMVTLRKRLQERETENRVTMMTPKMTPKIKSWCQMPNDTKND